MPESRPPYLLADGEGIMRMISASAADLIGSQPRDLEGVSLHEICESPGPAVFDAVFAGLRAAAEAPAPAGHRLAVVLRAAAGTGVDADLRLTLIPGLAEPGGVLVTIDRLDAPGRTTGAAAGPAAVAEVDREAALSDATLVCRGGRILEAGDGLHAMAGTTGRGLRGWKVSSLVAAEDLLPVIDLIRRVEAGEQAAAEFGFRLLRAQKQPPIDVAARARRIVHRGLPAVIVGLRDISESLHAARRAADWLARLDAALSATNDAVLVLGPAASASPVVMASRSFDGLFGVSGGAWLGRSFWDLWSAIKDRHASPGDEESMLRDLIGDPASMRVDRVTLADPGRRVLERIVGPLRDPEGRADGAILIFRDVTDRAGEEIAMRRAAEEAGRAREELERLHEELRLANEGLERRMEEMQRLNRDLEVLGEMKSNLLANVSHELQTPLVSIKGFTEMILKGHLGVVTSEQEQGLQVALRNINRLIGLIENLLAFARSQGPADALDLAVFPLSPLAHEAVLLVREAAESRGIRIAIEMPEKDLMIHADRNAVLEVLINLVSNAVKYNKDEGEVVVHAEPGRAGSARVEVRDTGIGIPKQDIERVFERNVRAGNAPDNVGGSGIGLALVRDILRRHGCVIRAESEEGRGSVFSFTLPLAQGRPRTAAAPQRRRVPPAGES